MLNRIGNKRKIADIITKYFINFELIQFIWRWKDIRAFAPILSGFFYGLHEILQAFLFILTIFNKKKLVFLKK